MKANAFINVDLVKIYSSPVKEERIFLTTLAWGDPVEEVERTIGYIKITIQDANNSDMTAYIIKSSSSSLKLSEVIKPLTENKVLRIDYVDVQQGDGAVIETHDGKIMLIDGGDNQLFARYLAGRFKGTTKAKPLEIDCILVTHGDADHFKGLIEIYDSEKNKKLSTRLFIKPQRVYHNGLVKMPGTINQKKLRDTEMFGTTILHNDRLFANQLHQDLTQVSDRDMNKYFLLWKKALLDYKARNSDLLIERLDAATQDAFDFLGQDIKVNLLAPLTNEINGTPCLPILSTPPKLIGTSQLKKEGNEITKRSYSASHTINGHSIVFNLEYGNASFLFCGDLNEEAEDTLSSKPEKLKTHVFKVPHHGSADFSNKFLEAAQPLISIVSSGDESEAKEYIHPRATLIY